MERNLFIAFLALAFINLINCSADVGPSFTQACSPSGHLSPSQATGKLKELSKTFATPRIDRVTDGIYVAIGYALANMIMIEGEDGIVIVDTTESAVQAVNILHEFRQITQKPLKGIILTHFHSDHVTGTQAIIEHSKKQGLVDGEVNIYAHSKLKAETRKFMALGSIAATRAKRQFGFSLDNTEYTNIGIGIDPDYIFDKNYQYGVLHPTNLVNDDLVFTLAGIHFNLLHTPGETNDQITVWIPQKSAVLPADNIYKAFPALYTIRGSPPRDAERWVESLDKVRSLKAKHMVPSHTEAVSGEDMIEDILTHYRDGIQYVHDQTVRWMNKGLTPDELVEKIVLPPKLRCHEYLQEFYGTVPWSVRAIYNYYLGWFDGKPENLFPLSQTVRFTKWQRLMQGSSPTEGNQNGALLADAERSISLSLENLRKNDLQLIDELQWALELSSGVASATPQSDRDHQRAKTIEIRCLKELAHSTYNANGRNYYLTYAAELEKDFTPGLSTLHEAILQLDIEDIMLFLKYRLNAEECDDNMIVTIGISFYDIKKNFFYTLRNCILEFKSPSEKLNITPDMMLILKSDLFRRILSKQTDARVAYTIGALKIEGRLLLLLKFMSLIEI